MEQEKPISDILNFCLINVDKPAGFTSHDVVKCVKKRLNAKRAGHCGTLDPMVTGVLPILLNRACRLSNYFMKKDKKYVGKMLLHSDIDEEKLKEEMNKFLGKIMQKPPVRSRVKRVLREREVNEFKIIRKNGKVVEFESDVEAGTYIRKLISDLGEKIGGAHMIELRRTRAGMFDEKDSHSLEEIEEAFKEYKENNNEGKLRNILISAEIIQNIIPRVNVKDEFLKKLLNGKPLMKGDVDDKITSEVFCLFNKDRFVGIYKKIEDAEQNSDNIILAKPLFVKD